MIVVKKKDGSNRICVDYYKVNWITLNNPQLMTTAKDLFQKRGQCQFFFMTDLSKDYWQIPMTSSSIAASTSGSPANKVLVWLAICLVFGSFDWWQLCYDS